MDEEYYLRCLRIAVVQSLAALKESGHGFQCATEDSIQVLMDIVADFLLTFGKELHEMAELASGRGYVTTSDVFDILYRQYGLTSEILNRFLNSQDDCPFPDEPRHKDMFNSSETKSYPTGKHGVNNVPDWLPSLPNGMNFRGSVHKVIPIEEELDVNNVEHAQSDEESHRVDAKAMTAAAERIRLESGQIIVDSLVQLHRDLRSNASNTINGSNGISGGDDVGAVDALRVVTNFLGRPNSVSARANGESDTVHGNPAVVVLNPGDSQVSESYRAWKIAEILDREQELETKRQRDDSTADEVGEPARRRQRMTRILSLKHIESLLDVPL